ncbi:MAG: isochorismate synthase [Bacteroidia bacterium]
MTSSNSYNTASQHIEQNKPFVVLRYPGEQTVSLLLLNANHRPNLEDELDEGTSYFAVSGFFDKSAYFFEIISKLSLTHEELNEIGSSFNLLEINHYPAPTHKNDYLQHVDLALKEIEAQSFNKVVLSKLATEIISEDKNSTIFDQFERLTNQSNQFCYAFHHTNLGTWMGASPETFLKIRNNRLHTEALAGTRMANSTDPWGEKEIHEQAIVKEYILNKLNTLGFQSVVELATFNKQLGTIEHLCTPIEADFTENMVLDEVLQTFHPTPALGGFPKNSAINFIRKTEEFDRELYGGFIGVVSSQASELYVNIRCMKRYRGLALLFAGAGINVGSLPELEWDETEEKLGTMRQVIYG